MLDGLSGPDVKKFFLYSVAVLSFTGMLIAAGVEFAAGGVVLGIGMPLHVFMYLTAILCCLCIFFRLRESEKKEGFFSATFLLKLLLSFGVGYFAACKTPLVACVGTLCVTAVVLALYAFAWASIICKAIKSFSMGDGDPNKQSIELPNQSIELPNQSIEQPTDTRMMKLNLGDSESLTGQQNKNNGNDNQKNKLATSTSLSNRNGTEGEAA